jgi:hypothetical protein
MRLLNEVHSRPLMYRGGTEVRGLVRVRGVDARVRGRGVVFESHDPVAVVVSGDAGVSRVSLPTEERRTLAFAVPPLAFLALRLFLRKGKK